MADAENKNPSFEVEDLAIPFSIGQDAWASYKEHRPEYPQSMFDLWFDYHRKHGGKFDAAHDVGAGGGILSATLARHFARVAVSDPGSSNLALARSVLHPASQFTFHLSPGEEPWLPPSSVDLVACGESLHWMDTEPALAAAAASLKPGGTFAAVFYGLGMYFPQDHPRLTHLMRDAQLDAYRMFFADSPGLQHERVRSAPRRCMRGFNSLALPDEATGAFRDWTRVNINLHGREDIDAFRALPEEEFPVEEGRVKDSEKVINVEDETWGREVDVDWVKGFLVSLTMPYDQRCWDLPSWVEFERIINQEFGGKVKAEWPVSVLLGSKK
ncbi:hypothetical protein LMH87_004066 [Akanthomyces muscarius]|uniref:Methyltransferase type 11 domain-containing protein n=1 Tax=Akanthomyces muscarius TaxID=2231603 RepID=A0A9W8Q4I5_AKAMU|nr:hypothetical protein LMH87_004066 [Akanthomyces muscarius]KAJ4145211.1 hypothetical protein LMH87_004066 [Akanthomyces muscarius]